MDAVPALAEVLASQQESMDVKAYFGEALTSIAGERLGYSESLEGMVGRAATVAPECPGA